MVQAEKKEKHGQKKEKKDKKTEEQLEKVKNDPMTGILMGTLAGTQANAEPPKSKKKNEQEILYAVDCDLEVLIILVKGVKGEQHKIF